MKKIFISYAREDKWVLEWLVPHLQEYDVELLGDQLSFRIGVSKLQNIEDAIKAADHSLLVMTPKWLESEWRELEGLIVQTGNPANRKREYFILLLEHCEMAARHSLYTPLDLTDKSNHESQIRLLMDQLGIRSLNSAIGGPKPEHIFLSSLPLTNGFFDGRKDVLDTIDAAWDSPSINVLAINGMGGQGKTAILREWIHQMARSNPPYRGGEKVFAWSFHGKSVDEPASDSSKQFLISALRSFGDMATAKGRQPEKDKAIRLAQLVRNHRTLLILDGVESLQSPPGGAKHCRIIDEGLAVLISELGHFNQGLVLVTSRIHIQDLDSFRGGNAVQISLDPLESRQGAALLKSFGIKGSAPELESMSEFFEGYPLSLMLSAKLLISFHKSDVSAFDKVPPLDEEPEWGYLARSIPKYYEDLLKDRVELELLHLFALHDGMGTMDLIDRCSKLNEIEGLNVLLSRLPNTFALEKAILNLKRLGLVTTGGAILKCNKIVSAYLERKFWDRNPEFWELVKKLRDEGASKSSENPKGK